MRVRYKYQNCQSLFGYAFKVHARSGGVCQLCKCGADQPLNFDLWRQMTVEHLIGESQGGYPKQLRIAIAERFPYLPLSERERLFQRLDEANTVTACRFCNATTSRARHPKSMRQLLFQAEGNPEEAVSDVITELSKILERKRSDAQWKIEAVREAFECHVLPQMIDRSREQSAP